MKEKAESFDLDGIVIHSPIPFPLEGASRHFRVRPVNITPPSIVPLHREVNESFFLPVRQIIPYLAQSVRAVDPDMWQFLWERTADVYGNTGRPNRRPWVNMTERTLEDGHVLQRFKKIYFRPHGVSGIESKGEALGELLALYGDYNLTHHDDDPWVTLGLAKLFPTVWFVLVQELESGILVTHEELLRFPNVRRVAQLRSAGE